MALAPDTLRERREIIDALLPEQNRRLSPAHFIQPVFLVEDSSTTTPSSIPSAQKVSVKEIENFADNTTELGIKSLLLFAVPEHRDDMATESVRTESLICRAARKLKNKTPELLLIADVCVCQYTPQGHCGIIIGGEINTQKTLEVLKEQSLLFARSGVDVLMPSGMTPGVVRHLREALDQNGFDQVAIINQSVKFASSYYGPFQKAAFYRGKLKDKRSYQVPFSNTREAIREITEDLTECGDMVVVKPAFGYQDIIYRVNKISSHPVIAVVTSGEHMIIEEMAKRKNMNPHLLHQELYEGLRRAGADLIVSYFASTWAKNRNKVTRLPNQT